MSINVQKAEFILSAASPKDFRRDALPQVAFAGRSNVGKSSVINRLLNRKNFARVGAAPGKTTQINYFKIDNAFYLVDLPGYGYARVSKGERDRWGRLMEGYFADPELMTLGVMIVDARHKPTADDCTMAQWYRGAGCPFLVVANKLDKLKKSEVEGNLQRIRETLELGEEDISGLLKQVLYEFPLKELDLFLPPWVDALPQEHPIKAALYGAIRQGAGQLHRIREVREQFLNQLTLTFCYRTVSGQPLHSFTGSNVAHVPASFPGFDIAAFLYELHHRLHRLLKVHCILEGDTAIGPLHISDGLAAQALIRSFIDVGVIGDDLCHQVDVHALLEKQRTDAACETVQRSGQRCGEYFRQKCTGVLRVQVADIELERVHHKLASAAAVILLQVRIDLSVHILSDPESLFDLIVVFH